MVSMDIMWVLAAPAIEPHIFGQMSELTDEEFYISPASAGCNFFVYERAGGWSECAAGNGKFNDVVMAVLTVIEDHAREMGVGGEISSEASEEEWDRARQIVRESLSTR